MINIASVVGVNTCIVILVTTQKWKFNISRLIMKQTVEEAARTHWSESTYNKDAELAYDERDSIAIKALAKAIALRAFKKGADWQAKQSPWISVEGRLPEENENIIIMCKHGAIFNGTYCNGVWFCMDGYINDIYKDSPIYTSMSSIPPLWDLWHGCPSPLSMRYSKPTRMYWNGLRRKEIKYEDIWNN